MTTAPLFATATAARPLAAGSSPRSGALGPAQNRTTHGGTQLRARLVQGLRHRHERASQSARRLVTAASSRPVVMNVAVPPPPAKKPNAVSKAFAKLQEYGLAGVLAYGLLNTAYYTIAFILVWTTVIKAPTGMGVQAAARKFLETFVIVWGGSQVTKAFRAGGAVVLAPLVDKMLIRIQEWMNMQRSIYDPMATKGEAFRAVLGVCLLFALGIFVTVVLRWAF